MFFFFVLECWRNKKGGWIIWVFELPFLHRSVPLQTRRNLSIYWFHTGQACRIGIESVARSNLQLDEPDFKKCISKKNQIIFFLFITLINTSEFHCIIYRTTIVSLLIIIKFIFVRCQGDSRKFPVSYLFFIIACCDNKRVVIMCLVGPSSWHI